MKQRKISIKEAVSQYWPTPPKYEVEAAGQRVWKRLSDELDKHDTSLRSLYGDGWSAPALKSREFQVLSAIALLRAGASLADIHEAVARRDARVSATSVWLTLKRMEWRGLLNVEIQGWPHFQITEDGDRALRRAHAEGKVWTVANETDPLLGAARSTDDL